MSFRNPYLDPDEIDKWMRKFWIFDAAASVAWNGGRRAKAVQIKRLSSSKNLDYRKHWLLRRQRFNDN